MPILIRLLVNVFGILLAASLVPGIEVRSLFTALVVVILLGVVNYTLKPLLIVLTLPINILTLGLFTFVINGLMLMFVATIVKGFEVNGFWAAFFGALVLTVVNFVAHRLDKSKQVHVH